MKFLPDFFGRGEGVNSSSEFCSRLRSTLNLKFDFIQKRRKRVFYVVVSLCRLIVILLICQRTPCEFRS
jgi:hypothetical protein